MKDDVPLHMKLGYERALEMESIREELVKEGRDPNSWDLYFAANRRYEERHRDDPTYRERHDAWKQNNTIRRGPAPLTLTEEEIAYIADRLAGTNNILGQSALDKLFAALPSPNTGEKEGGRE